MTDACTEYWYIAECTLASQVAVWPNQLFPVAVSVLDQFGLPTSVTAQYSYTSKDVSCNDYIMPCS